MSNQDNEDTVYQRGMSSRLTGVEERVRHVESWQKDFEEKTDRQFNLVFRKLDEIASRGQTSWPLVVSIIVCFVGSMTTVATGAVWLSTMISSSKVAPLEAAVTHVQQEQAQREQRLRLDMKYQDQITSLQIREARHIENLQTQKDRIILRTMWEQVTQKPFPMSGDDYYPVSGKGTYNGDSAP